MANTLSPAAKKCRREYWKTWYAEHPEDRKAARARYWEKRARTIYGPMYEGPEPDQELSEHARTVRKIYYKEYRKAHAEDIKRYIANYWERQAGKTKTTKEG